MEENDSTFIQSAGDFAKFLLGEADGQKSKSVIIVVSEEREGDIKTVVGVGGHTKLLAQSLVKLKQEAQELFQLASLLETYGELLDSNKLKK